MNDEKIPVNYARPVVYIDVVMNNQKTVYDVETARILVHELTAALNLLDAPPETPSSSTKSGKSQTQ